MNALGYTLKQYTSFFQRLISFGIAIGFALLVFGLLIVGIVFFWYTLVFILVAYVVRSLYTYFNTNKGVKQRAASTDAPFESGHVEVGEFGQGPGRIIEHEDKTQ